MTMEERAVVWYTISAKTRKTNIADCKSRKSERPEFLILSVDINDPLTLQASYGSV